MKAFAIAAVLCTLIWCAFDKLPAFISEQRVLTLHEKELEIVSRNVELKIELHAPGDKPKEGMRIAPPNPKGLF